jgi:transcriptional regulator with XRE-family HTH domain
LQGSEPVKIIKKIQKYFNISLTSKMSTAADQPTLSFGRYLQAVRLEKGISLEAVSKETRIRRDVLRLIEEENHNRLPDEAFVRGFIRAYAKAIGADSDEAIRRYHSRLQVIRKIAQSENDLTQSRKRFWPRLLLSIGTLLCLIFLSVSGVSIFLKPPSNGKQAKPQEVQQPVQNNNADSAPDSLPPPAIREEEVAAEIVQKKLVLKIEAMEETWMKVVIDHREHKEFRLNPGDHIELEATNAYNLLIGNAGGVKLILNDNPLEVQGNSGQVVTLQIP